MNYWSGGNQIDIKLRGERMLGGIKLIKRELKALALSALLVILSLTMVITMALANARLAQWRVDQNMAYSQKYDR